MSILAQHNFIKEHPDIKLHQHFMSSAQAREALIGGSIQFGITHKPILDNQIQWTFLTNSELTFLVSDKHPLIKKGEVNLIDLAEYPFLTSDLSQELVDAFISFCKQENFIPKIVFSGDEPRLISSIMKDNRSVFITNGVLTSNNPPERSFKYFSEVHIKNTDTT